MKCADCGRILYRGLHRDGEEPGVPCDRDGCDQRLEAFNGLSEFPVTSHVRGFTLTPLPGAEPWVEWGFKLRFSAPGSYRELDCAPLSYGEVCEHNVCKVTREGKPFWFGYLDIEGHGEGYWLFPRAEEEAS